MDNYKIDFLGISETRWTGAGRMQLANGQTLLYTGRQDNHHSEGIGIVKKLMEWKPVGSRLLGARFNSKYTKLSIVSCYAPTEDAEEEDKDIFYDQLQHILQNVPAHDMLLVIGDFNAKVGNENTGKEQIMGENGCRIMNENGKQICELCEENNLVVGGTLFQHKDIHKLTWTSPDGSTINQIDHILINRKWRSSLHDVKARRSADVASDHSSDWTHIT
ncbi:craniofacial development protein 2-like [Gigantopelta aegis]|uniref:craniofacial development protein 2-like n=1 Tax=Gigantopelta aegis TaxID=1735272 RepID=UPI001B88BE3C|nr:craniofacial development protein 2-like [Gigantopelta aegis]